MEQVEREMAVDSLTHLESYYQSRYEYYLAMATEAKEHRERVGLLLQDLLRVENYRVESSSISDRRVNLELSSLEESKVVEAGGQVHQSKMAIGEFGFCNLAMNTEGNLFGLHSMK